MVAPFQLLARYNCLANERLYAACAQLDFQQCQQPREGSFGSIHALLNHILLSDRIWMARFKRLGGETTPPLNRVLFLNFDELQQARVEQDREIEAFFSKADETFWTEPIRYVNRHGNECMEMPMVAALHFFNHQTHHRGQVHVMLSQTSIRAPSLDLHRLINP